MNAPANWVSAALSPKGPTNRELDTEENRSKSIGDAVHFRQWDTAYAQAVSLLAFVEKWKLIADGNLAAKRAAHAARRGAA